MSQYHARVLGSVLKKCVPDEFPPQTEDHVKYNCMLGWDPPCRAWFFDVEIPVHVKVVDTLPHFVLGQPITDAFLKQLEEANTPFTRWELEQGEWNDEIHVELYAGDAFMGTEISRKEMETMFQDLHDETSINIFAMAAAAVRLGLPF